MECKKSSGRQTRELNLGFRDFQGKRTCARSKNSANSFILTGVRFRGHYYWLYSLLAVCISLTSTSRPHSHFV
jgi:hypothetical protein